jgi:hypothetical protein
MVFSVQTGSALFLAMRIKQLSGLSMAYLVSIRK